MADKFASGRNAQSFNQAVNESARSKEVATAPKISTPKPEMALRPDGSVVKDVHTQIDNAARAELARLEAQKREQEQSRKREEGRSR